MPNCGLIAIGLLIIAVGLLLYFLTPEDGDYLQ